MPFVGKTLDRCSINFDGVVERVGALHNTMISNLSHAGDLVQHLYCMTFGQHSHGAGKKIGWLSRSPTTLIIKY
jgi:hypothetical protein